MQEGDLATYDCEKSVHSPHLLTTSKEICSSALNLEPFLDPSYENEHDTLEAKDISSSHDVDISPAPSGQMVNISLPTISRWTVRIQHAQSSMGKFSDVAIFGLAQSFGSYALLLFFTDEFSKYHTIIAAELRSRLPGLYDANEQFYLSGIQVRVTSFTQTSILCGVYTALDALFRFLYSRFGKSSSKNVNVFEVLIPLGFGLITQLCACEMFFEWWNDPKRPVYEISIATGGIRTGMIEGEEDASFMDVVAVFLLVWFLYFRVRPLLQRW